MPKMKTRRAAAKRFQKSGSGKLMRRRAYHSHILTKKTTKQKRRLRKGTVVAPVDAKRIIKTMPYL
ncbi:MAG: 50S ribosomal protein L35 [Myxococcota bacterium]|nr:50S ribosomal protein L35 [Myxococcota bacterium]